MFWVMHHNFQPDLVYFFIALVTGNVRTEQAAACETQDLVIKCPAKTSLYIQFANYGRLRSSNDRPCHNIVQTGARSNVSIFHTAYDINEESTDCMASNSREVRSATILRGYFAQTAGSLLTWFKRATF